ncbi:MAG: helix-turn-helix domain-containing protein [Clostridia bacterium]|nr:helix-turn-helix domain-containing protein [Clostridia bacterium]
MAKIGDKIKELRLEKGLSQMQLGKLVGASQKAIDYWERSVNEPKSSYIIALVKVFDITFDDFFENVE